MAGREVGAARGDAQPAPVDDRHVELVGAVADGALHDQQAARRVEVVGQHVDDAGGLPVDGEGVGHRDRVGGALGARLDVDADRALVERGVAEGRVVAEEVGPGPLAGEGQLPGVEVGDHLGVGLLRHLAAQRQLGVGGVGVGPRQVVEQRPDLDRLADLTAYDVGLGLRRVGLLVLGRLDLEAHRLRDRGGAAVGHGELHAHQLGPVGGTGGAVKRIRPSAVVRAAAPVSSPPTAFADSRSKVSPSLSSRQSPSTGTASSPPCGTL